MPLPVNKRQLLRFLSLTGAAIATQSLRANANETLPIEPIQVHKIKDHFSFLAGGPENSEIGQWSLRISAALSQLLQKDPSLPVQFTTGYDGVTGANLFDTRISPDGYTAFITSGNTFIASLSGDKRVHFDYERWIPILTGVSPAITIARQPFQNSIPNLLKNRSMKVAVSSIIGKELPTLLGIELLKITPIPVEGLTDQTSAIKALKAGEIDALQLSSPEAIAMVPELLKDGLHCFFSLDNSTKYGPRFVDLYNQMHHSKTAQTLFNAWNAIALASRINVAVLLPMLSPSSIVSKWRINTNKILQNPSIIEIAKHSNVTLAENPTCNEIMNQVSPSLITTMALQRWLTAKFSL